MKKATKKNNINRRNTDSLRNRKIEPTTSSKGLSSVQSSPRISQRKSKNLNQTALTLSIPMALLKTKDMPSYDSNIQLENGKKQDCPSTCRVARAFQFGDSPETPRHEANRSFGLDGGSMTKKIGGINSKNVRVVCRIRPLNKAEQTLLQSGVGKICCSIREGEAVEFPEEHQIFSLDSVFGPESPQVKLYEEVGRPTIEDVIDGYNGTIFTYGQTGSGKTFTMFGLDIHDPELKGLIPRAAQDLFASWEVGKEAREVEIRCSMLEIYKENLRDLMNEDEPVDLKIKEHPIRGTYVDGLSQVSLLDAEEMLSCIEGGQERRVSRATTQNDLSSRSHLLFILEVRQTLTDDTEKRGVLNLVDLAGSEKVGRTGAEGTTFEEGTKINLSLSVLGTVIHSLSTGTEYIPYRDSKLTRLLRESLAGNFKTTLIVTTTLHSSQMENSINTLKFAQRAKKLKNKVKKNIKLSQDQMQKIIDELREELRKKNEEIGLFKRLPVKRLSTFHSEVVSNELESPSQVPDNDCTIRKESLNSEERLKQSEELEKLQQEVDFQKIRIQKLEEERKSLQETISELKTNLTKARENATNSQLKILELESIIDETNSKRILEETGTANEKTKTKILSNQVAALASALEDSYEECTRALKSLKSKSSQSEFFKLTIIR